MSRTKQTDDRLRHAGLRLKAARAATGLTQDALSAAIGTTRQVLNNWEHGYSTADPWAICRMWMRFGIPMHWTYTGDIRGADFETQQKLLRNAALLGAQMGGLYDAHHVPAELPPMAPARPSQPGRLHDASSDFDHLDASPTRRRL